MIVNEDDAKTLADRLGADESRLCSPMSVWETVSGLCRSHAYPIAAARAAVRDFVAFTTMRLVAIGGRESELAQEAYAQFGRGRHPAKLNMGDCFAYACAKANGAKLLYKGEDFAKTDLA